MGPLRGLLLQLGVALYRADDKDGLVALQVDLPPDVQRMFEEMCELEGISQSDMLTRWIDTRWEVMGYKDSDLEAVEALEDTAKAESCEASGSCREGRDSSRESGRDTSRDMGRPSASSDSRESRPSTESIAAEPRKAASQKPAVRAEEPAAEESEEEEEEEDEEDGEVPDIDAWMRLHGGR
mmetsp:Transcript_53353/g.95762  ORF Transcript_53353/g.95762 Transcript_53353/m.95762 type:complete len:182 (-) Transcript_53353:71-616(-)